MDDSSRVNQGQDFNFQKLTPTHIEDLGAYEEALNYAFSEKDILNIALTGPYASGKTSIINSYIKKKKLNTMNISLAYFEPIEGEEGSKFNDEDVKQKLKEERDQRARELMLERKIINQLIHQIDAEDIPDTEFRVKHKASKFQVTVWAFFITFLIMFFGYFSKDWFFEVIGINAWLPIILFAVVIVTVFFFSYQIIEVQSRKSVIQRLKIFDAELDISGSKKDESYFDKYLDEIIYILEQSKVKAIVFEDIDRYDDNLILSKLRELNCIYNRKQEKTDKQIKFIYLIKDEMFESKDRTKFFDFILPIIPIVDASNSLSKLNEFFEKGGVKSDFKDRTFLHDLSLYIDDIRLIKNIYNEYMIYRDKLHLSGDKKHDWLVPERLLAVIIYKNLFPKDFSETRLGHGRGVLHRIINSFAQMDQEQKSKKIPKIDQEIAQLQQAIQDAEAEHLNSLLELQYVYIELPYKEFWLPETEEHRSRIARSSLSNTEFLERVIDNGKHAYLHRDIYYGQDEDFTELFQKVERNAEFIRRKSLLKGGKEHIINEKNNKIKEKKQEKILLQLKKKIIDIIKESNQSIDTLFEKHLAEYEGALVKKEYEVLKNSAYSPILGYFLRKGFVDENYSDYMSFFYEGGIHVNDTSFLRNLADGVNSDWDLELRTVDILLESRLEKEHFHSTHVLNFSLLDYLLTVRNNSLSTFVATLEQNKCIDFIDQYILREQAALETCDEGKEKQQQQKIMKFIDAVNKQWPTYWDLTAIDKQFYLYLSFQKVTVPLLSKMNLENKLVNYINNTGDFFKLDEANGWIVDLRSIELVLAELDIKMKQITEANTELLTLLCDDECYEINLANIDYLLANQYGMATDKTHYLQTIESLPENASLYKYVKADTNINLLMQELLNSEIAHFDDNEETVIKILNNTAIKVEHKQAYIAKLATVVDELSSVTDKKVWDSLLINQKLTYSAQNIVYYFFNYLGDEGETIEDEEREFTPVLVEFVNSQNTSFKDESVSGLLEKNQVGTIFRKVVQSKIINNERYSALLSWLNTCFTNFNLIDIDDDKMSILIQQGVVRLEKQRQKIEEKSVIQSLKFLRDHYSQYMIAFVVKNIDQYIERLGAQPEEFEHNELLGLLNAEITDEQKLALLSLAYNSISLQGLEVSEEIKAYILEHNFDIDDFDYICSRQCYDLSNDSNKKTIRQLLLHNIYSLHQLDDFSYDLLQVLLAEESLTIEEKYKLLTKVLDHLEPTQAFKCFEVIELSVGEGGLYNYQFSSLFKRKRPTITKNSITEPIVNIFISKGWASKSDDEESVDSFKLNGRDLVRE